MLIRRPLAPYGKSSSIHPYSSTRTAVSRPMLRAALPTFSDSMLLMRHILKLNSATFSSFSFDSSLQDSRVLIRHTIMSISTCWNHSRLSRALFWCVTFQPPMSSWQRYFEGSLGWSGLTLQRRSNCSCPIYSSRSWMSVNHSQTTSWRLSWRSIWIKIRSVTLYYHGQ